MRAVAVVVCLFVALSALAEHRNFRVAQVRHKDVDFVFVKVDPAFFDRDHAVEQREWTDLKVCAREAHLTGHVFAVGVVNRKFKFYGSTDFHDIVKKLDMQWVNAHLNRDLACDY